MIILFITGLMAGLSVASFILGKELYSYYKKNASMLIKMRRIELMNRQLKGKLHAEKSNQIKVTLFDKL
jgi:hypothetical protein